MSTMTTDDNTINDNTISQLSEYQRRTLEALLASPGPRVTIALTTEQTAGQFIGGTFLMGTEPGTWRASADDRHYLRALPPRDPVPTLQALDETFRRYANQ